MKVSPAEHHVTIARRPSPLTNVLLTARILRSSFAAKITGRMVQECIRHVRRIGWRAALFIAFWGTAAAHGQGVAPQAITAAGAHGMDGSHHLSWSLGQPASATYSMPPHHITAGVQQPDGPTLAVRVTVLLDGPYRAANGLMHDSLRTRALLPWSEPYTALGLAPSALPAGLAFHPAALLTDGADAIVDWVIVQLRQAGDPSTVVMSRAALLQRDGDIVEGDGIAPVRFAIAPGSHHVAVLHRNHLGVMTQAPVALANGPNIIDLTDGSTPVYGVEAMRTRDGRTLLWAGDVNADGQVIYTGSSNDRDPQLQLIGGSIPTGTIIGYLPHDVNLDGTVKYTGAQNDREPILQTVGGAVPTNTRHEQLP